MNGWIGLLTIAVLLAVIVGRKMSPIVALIVVPTVASVCAGFGAQTAAFIVSGLKNMAPIVAMFVFAILFFGILTDAGVLDPIIRRIVRATGGRPTRLVVGTVLLTLLIHLDGSGAVAFMVVIPAMLPVYDRVGIPRRVIACVTSMAAGTNFLPWTGPTIRAAAALHTTTATLFRPLIPVQLVGLLFVFAVAWRFGRQVERGAPAATVVVQTLLHQRLADSRRDGRPHRWLCRARGCVHAGHGCGPDDQLSARR